MPPLMVNDFAHAHRVKAESLADLTLCLKAEGNELMTIHSDTKGIQHKGINGMLPIESRAWPRSELPRKGVESRVIKTRKVKMPDPVPALQYVGNSDDATFAQSTSLTLQQLFAPIAARDPHIVESMAPGVPRFNIEAYNNLIKNDAGRARQAVQRREAALWVFRAEGDQEARTRERIACLVAANELLRKEIIFQKNIELELRTREMEAHRICAVASCTDKTVIIMDADYRIEWVNESFTHNYGFCLAEVRGKYSNELFGDQKVVPGMPPAIEAESKADRGHCTEVVRCGKDQKRRWLIVESQAIVDDNGHATGFIEIETDISAQKRTETELRGAKLVAEEANFAKSLFLTNMSHEIRTPMNAIIGITELSLQTNHLTLEQREYLNLVRDSSASLMNIINGILDFSKIEAGQMALEIIPFSLRETLGDTMKSLALNAHRKGLELVYEIAPDTPDALLGDSVRLRQVVTNLVGNAIKFTEHGEVVIRVKPETSNGHEVTCQFSVRDSGIGIAKEKQVTIFSPFHQADTSTTRFYGGTGLGLSISTRLVEMMKGKIWLKSKPDKGSTFYFTARLGLQAPARENSSSIDLKGLLTLVVDNHAVSRRFLVNMLRQWNVEVHEANCWLSARQAIEQATNNPYRLVLLADSLPDVDSYAIASQIRKSSGFKTGNVVIMGSALRRDESDNPVDQGEFSFLVKPAKQSELLSMIGMTPCNPADTDFKAGVAAFDDVKKPKQKLEILLVEDNPINRRLSQLVLEKEGHSVVVADNGMVALDVLERRSVDLILMDLQMPKMDGNETTAVIRLRERKTGGHIPIIALTAHAMAHHRECCLQAGMDDYLSKPIQPATLLDAIQRLNGKLTKHPRTAEHRTMVFDKDALLERVNGDMRLLGEISGLFLSECAKLMARTGEAIRNCDAEDLSYVLHTLRGMFLSFSAEAAQEVTGKLQELSLDQERNLVEATYLQLGNEVKALRDELVGFSEEILI